MNIVRSFLLQSLSSAAQALNEQLSVCYQLCTRTGFDLPTPGLRIITLQANEVLSLHEQCEANSLEVLEGTVWLTSTPADRDVLLRKGERLPLTNRWPFVIQAIGEAAHVLLDHTVAGRDGLEQ